jgi:hypothetical protein
VTGSSERSGVEPAVEQLDLLGLAAEQVDQAGPRRVGILQIGDLVGEHHRVVAPVAIEQRHGGAVVRGEHGSGDGQDGRDPAARGDHDMVAGLVQIGSEGAGWFSHLDHVAGPHLAHEPAGDRAARDLAHADARRTALDRAY